MHGARHEERWSSNGGSGPKASSLGTCGPGVARPLLLQMGTLMRDHRILIRTSYWVAAVADFVIAILVLIPERMGVPHFVYPMGLMSAVAFSWAVLLIVADRKPIERKWVLLPTILVAFLLGVAGVYAAFVDLIPFERVIASSAAIAVVLWLLVYTCYRTRNG